MSYKLILVRSPHPCSPAHQICTIDRQRLIERWGRLSPETMTKVDEALKVSLGLVPL